MASKPQHPKKRRWFGGYVVQGTCKVDGVVTVRNAKTGETIRFYTPSIISENPESGELQTCIMLDTQMVLHEILASNGRQVEEEQQPVPSVKKSKPVTPKQEQPIRKKKKPTTKVKIKKSEEENPNQMRLDEEIPDTEDRLARRRRTAEDLKFLRHSQDHLLR